MILSDVIAGVRRYLADPPGQRNTVAIHTSGQVMFTFPLRAIQENTLFSSGLQTFYVNDVNPATQTAYVDVEQGSSALLPVGARVRVSPRYTGWDVMQALNDELVSLSSPLNGLFQMKTADLTYTNLLTGFDFDAPDVQSIFEVRTATPGPRKDWPRLPATGYRLDRSAPTTDFPSGQSLNIFQAAYQGFDVRVMYKAAFGQFAALADDTSTVGLQSTAVPLLMVGAAIRCMTGKEILRNLTDVQGDTRRAAEVPAGAVANSVNGLRVLRQQMISEEAARLQAIYPPHRGD